MLDYEISPSLVSGADFRARRSGERAFAYLGDRLGINGTAQPILPLPDLVGAKSA